MAEFYSARGWEIPPLPWTNLSPPFSINEPIVYQGQIMKDDKGVPITIKKYSDTLAIFLLKAHRPKKFQEMIRREVTGEDGGPLVVNVHQFPDEDDV